MCSEFPTDEESKDFLMKYGFEAFMAALGGARGPYIKALQIQWEGRSSDDIRADILATGLPLLELGPLLDKLDSLKGDGE